MSSHSVFNLDSLYPDVLLRDQQAKVNALRELQSQTQENWTRCCRPCCDHREGRLRGNCEE